MRERERERESNFIICMKKNYMAIKTLLFSSHKDPKSALQIFSKTWLLQRT